MNTVPEHANTSDLIAAAGDRLTPTDRRIAEAVLAEPTLLAFGTVTALADTVGTSRPSIVRFAHKLGFSGYTALQEYVRGALSVRLSRPSERIRYDDSTRESARTGLERAVASVLEVVDTGQLKSLSAPLVDAATVWIASGETSRAGAFALHSGLSIVRPDVRFIDDHMVATDLSSAGNGDAAVIFDFARYRKQAIAVAHVLRDCGVKIVAITDGPLSPLVALTNTWCNLEVPAIGPLDSSVPAVAMAELIVAHVATQLHDVAQTRIDRIEALWERTDTFVSP
ncbi:MAG: MurR/RpiR family transcriptional regulator [Acidimicrobiia bacterium]